MSEVLGNTTDRRAFFRINDRLTIHLREIDAKEARLLVDTILSSTLHSTHPAQQLSSLQNAFQHLTDQIGHEDRNVARALRMLDEKINLIANNLQLLQQPIEDETADDVNLSGGGIALMTDQVLAPKSMVEVHLQLLPSGLPLHAIAKVISCEDLGDHSVNKPNLLRLAFTHMNEIDRNILVKHTLGRQAENLRVNKNPN